MTITLEMVRQITIEDCHPDTLHRCLHNVKVELNDNRTAIQQISFKSIGRLVSCFENTDKVRFLADSHNFQAIPAKRDLAETILSNLFFERYVCPSRTN